MPKPLQIYASTCNSGLFCSIEMPDYQYYAKTRMGFDNLFIFSAILFLVLRFKQQLNISFLYECQKGYVVVVDDIKQHSLTISFVAPITSPVTPPKLFLAMYIITKQQIMPVIKTCNSS